MSLYISRIMTRWCITYFVIDIPKFPSLFDKGPGPPTFEQRPILDSKSWNIIWGLIIFRKWKLEPRCLKELFLPTRDWRTILVDRDFRGLRKLNERNGVVIIKCVLDLVKFSRVAGIEPAQTVLKTVVLPLNYTPTFRC